LTDPFMSSALVAKRLAVLFFLSIVSPSDERIV
jgi:hypothetical protein